MVISFVVPGGQAILVKQSMKVLDVWLCDALVHLVMLQWAGTLENCSHMRRIKRSLKITLLNLVSMEVERQNGVLLLAVTLLCS